MNSKLSLDGRLILKKSAIRILQSAINLGELCV
jgi:hypothetical protein